MKLKRLAGMAALCAAVTLGIGERAKADYSYSTSIVVTGVTAPGVAAPPTAAGNVVTYTNPVGGGVTTVTFLNVGRGGYTVPGSNSIDIGDIVVTTTDTSANGATFSINYTDTFTLVNTPPPGVAATGGLPLTGILTLSGVNTGSGVITNAYNPPTTASGPFAGLTFSGATQNFASPTVNGAAGSLGGLITATAVPEPVSLLMLGLGLGGVGLARFRNNRSAKV